MSRYVGKHRRSEPEPEGTLTLVPDGTLTIDPGQEDTRLLPASTWADPPQESDIIETGRARRRGPGGKFAKVSDGPDEQEDQDDQDPQPGDPVRQVPGEKDPDPRANLCAACGGGLTRRRATSRASPPPR
jgi:hypothetical protein